MKTRAHLITWFVLAVVVGGLPLVGALAKPAAKVAAPNAAQPAAPIEGAVIPRANGFLGLKLSDNHFVLSFYDAKQKKVAPDVARATLRWPVKYQPADERTVLNPTGDGFTLASLKTVRAPHSFRLYLSLFAEGAEQAAESYVIEFQG